MALAVQDRVIRLEMRLRLHQLLAGDMKTRVSDLTPRFQASTMAGHAC